MPAQDDAISEPRLLFPHNPLSPRKPDFDFEEEFEAAQAAGFEVGFVNTDDLTVTRNVSSGPVLYRGWMLRTDRYAELYRTLALQGLEMLTCPQAYRQTHHLPAWYDQLKELTPCSCWFPEATGWSAAAVESLIGPGPWIVKDYVKSAKHYWNEACYIPQSANLQQVTRKFLEIRDDDLEGGLVYRRFLHLRGIGVHSRSGLPLTLEFRAFFWGTQQLAQSRYWEEGVYPERKPPWELFREALGSISSPFFTVDVACGTDERWWIVEIGDGQVSGLPPGLDPLEFYTALRRASAV